MISTTALVSFITTSVLLALTPGPDNLFVLTQSALHGKKAGLLLTLGFCSGLIFHTLAVALGVSSLLLASPLTFTLLKIIGALYLLYIAWQLFFEKSSIKNKPQQAYSNFGLYRKAIFMNISNPKVSLFFLAFLPQFINIDKDSPLTQIILLGFIFMLVTLVVFGGIALLSSSLTNFLNHQPKTKLILQRMTALIFIVIAITLFI